MSIEEMRTGYCDGRSDTRDLLPVMSNYSPCYIHGWFNGRDDRIGKPRDTAENLRKRADELLEGTAK